MLRWGPTVTATGDITTDVDRLMTAIAEAAGATWTAQGAPATS
jgi:hypothetical protein